MTDNNDDGALTATDEFHDGEDEDEKPVERADGEPVISRRGALAALVGAGMGAAGAMGVAQTSEAATGGLGEANNALEAAYLAELRGPILDQGTPIDQLVNIVVAEKGKTVNADRGTLIIRYNP